MDGEWIAALIFYGILGIIIYFNRKKFSWIQGIILAIRTKKPLKWMDKLKPKSVIWKIFGTLCIPLGFYFMPQLIYMLGEKAFDILLNPGETAGVALAIPGIRIPGSPIYIPLFYGIAAIGVLALVHEMAHGIIAKSEGIKLKSSGFGMLLIFPLFFVEPDQKSVTKASKLSRLRMTSAGAGANITLSFIIFMLLTATLSPFFINNTVTKGIELTSIVEGFPANLANMTSGSVITGANNIEVQNLTAFSEIVITHSPGDELILNTDQGDYNIITVANPNNETLPYLGVFLENVIEYSEEAKTVYGETFLGLVRILYDLLLWIAFLNISIGIMNLLPIWGLDGSRMIYDLLSYLMSTKKAKTITSIISSICIGLLLINIAPVFLGLFGL